MKTNLLENKTVLTFNEFCEYANISKSFAYRLTSEKRVPHYKPTGKKIYFKKTEVDEWLFQNSVKTIKEIEQIATDFTLKNKR